MKQILLAFLVCMTAFPVFAEEKILPEEKNPPIRLGAMFGIQRTNRSAVIFGPSLEIPLSQQIFLRGEGLIEFGDLNDPFGPNNFVQGNGPHVNHALFGPTFRPTRFAEYNVAGGVEVGTMILHSIFTEKDFTFLPAAGVFVQAGKRLGGLEMALQFRFDASGPIPEGDQEGNDVPTASGRVLLTFELPVY